MKLNYRFIAKAGLLLVVLGFFMPVACGMNGFENASEMMTGGDALSGLLLYIMFFSAIAGAIIGFMLLSNKTVDSKYDWVAISVCIASGLIVYFSQGGTDIPLETGAYVILIGWIIALGAQILAKRKG